MVHNHGWQKVVLTLVVFLGATACGRFEVKKDIDRLAELKPETERGAMPLLVMTEPFFSGAFEPYQVVQKSHDLVWSLTRDGIPTVAPWEYRTYDLERGMMLGTNALWLLREEGVEAEEALRLDLRVIMTGGSREVAVQDEGAVVAGVRHTQSGEVRVVVRRFKEGEPLMELTLGFEEDPISKDVTTWDARPELRAAIREAARLVSERLKEHYQTPGLERVKEAKMAFNPQPMFVYAVRDGRPLMESFLGMEAMDALAGKLRYYQYFDPDITVDRVMEFEERGPGILVEAPGVLRAHGLEAGDYITHVGEREALGRQVLWRPLMLEREQTLTLQVRRRGARRRVVIPLSEAAVQELSSRTTF